MGTHRVRPAREAREARGGYLRVSDGEEDVAEEEAGGEDGQDARRDHHVHVHLGRVVVHGVEQGAPVVDEQRAGRHEEHAAGEGEEQQLQQTACDVMMGAGSENGTENRRGVQWQKLTAVLGMGSPATSVMMMTQLMSR